METAAFARGRIGRGVRRAAARAARWIADTASSIVPERCVCCDGSVARPGERPAGEPVAWCAACALRSVPLGERFCLDCPGGAARRECRKADHLRLLAALQFGRETGALVRSTKYEACPERMAAWRDAWAESVTAAVAVDLLVPVPAHPVRVRERGFDVTERWARTLGELHGVPVARALRRARATPPQAGADRLLRRANVAGAFAAGTEMAAVAGRRIALVDDVVTTGATVRASAAVIRRAGALAVEAWAFAFEPLE